jgi:hypothetical protein
MAAMGRFLPFNVACERLAGRPLLAHSGHLLQCGFISAFGGKADIIRWAYHFRLKLTRSGSAECMCDPAI